jgi:hypothetical protein
MKPPLHSVDPDDWRVYRDWEMDHGCPEGYALLLWYVARGLELRPRMTLKAGLTGFGDEVYWAAKSTLPHSEATPLRWVERQATNSIVPGRLFLGTPADLPGLVDLYPAVAWQFFREVARLLYLAEIHTEEPPSVPG